MEILSRLSKTGPARKRITLHRSIFIFVFIFFCIGCSHVISHDIRSISDDQLSLSAVFKDPESYHGSIIIIGGTIVRTLNKDEGTYIEVIEKPLDYRGIPKHSDSSYGRFIVIHPGFLDGELFSKGRHVTVAGEIIGSRVQKLDEMDYSYLVLQSREIHLVRPGRGTAVYFGIGVSHSF